MAHVHLWRGNRDLATKLQLPRGEPCEERKWKGSASCPAGQRHRPSLFPACVKKGRGSLKSRGVLGVTSIIRTKEKGPDLAKTTPGYEGSRYYPPPTEERAGSEKGSFPERETPRDIRKRAALGRCTQVQNSTWFHSPCGRHQGRYEHSSLAWPWTKGASWLDEASLPPYPQFQKLTALFLRWALIARCGQKTHVSLV